MFRLTLRTLLLLVLLTLVIALTGLDLKLSALFYRQGVGFFLADHQPWALLYRFGEWPALLLAGCSLMTLLASHKYFSLRPWRKSCVFLLAFYLLGPGLLVNLLLKDHWGRERPVDISLFGGDKVYSQPWQPGASEGGKSFPSGHTAVAFYMTAPYFLLREKKRRQALAWLAGGLSFGLLMGATRIIQGGHFASDVLWSAGLIYLCGTLLSQLLLRKDPLPPMPVPWPGEKILAPVPLGDARSMSGHPQRQVHRM